MIASVKGTANVMETSLLSLLILVTNMCPVTVGLHSLVEN